ncbi:MAG: glycosyltransferase family 2 protein [Chloroflexi bacterium]|nr:glycosyltransferase family 2 protein [Chloroflexota bacterium]
MADPLVTVAIPTFNREALLRETLSTVVAQDLRDFEVLIVDNASPYDVEALVAAFRDPRLRLVRQPRNVGLAANWRTALSAPRTRYVAVLEDDNLWAPWHLSAAIEALERHPTASFYGCSAAFFGSREGRYHPDWATRSELYVRDWHETGYGIWLAGPPVLASAVVFRRQALTGLFWGGRTWPWCRDWLWWGQFALQGPFLFNPASGLHYRWHGDNDTYRFVNQRGRAHWHFTVRELARRAYAQGALRNLAAEIDGLPAATVSTIVLALSTPDTPPALARQARRLFERRRDLAAQPGCARDYRIAARIGGWWLPWADVRMRVMGRWWPTGRW